MKKIFYTFFVVVFAIMALWSCTQDYTEMVSIIDDTSIQSQKVLRTITDDEAYDAVERFLEQIDPQTRGFKRTVPRGKMFTLRRSHVNRAISRGSQKDTPLLGFINLGDNSNSFSRSDDSNLWSGGNGYAVVNYNPLFGDTILIVTDRGNIQEEDVIIDDDVELPDSLRERFATLYCEEDDDYYIGNFIDSSFVNVSVNWAWNYVHLHNNFIGEDGPPTIVDAGDPEIDIPNPQPVDTLEFLPAMLKTHWHQYAPYNKYFPTGTINRYVAGCIPIAAAQILAYLKNVSLSEHFGITTSSWNSLEKDFAEDDTDTININNLAKIIKQIADGIDVQYNFLNSGGTFATPKKLKQYLKSIGCNTIRGFGYGTNTENRVIQSLSNNYPVFIAALSPKYSGHAWVIDGYCRLSNKSHYYTHCNMGWRNSACNGWYYYNMFNTNNSQFQHDNINDNGVFAYTWWFRTLFFD